MSQILIVDDDKNLLKVLSIKLKNDFEILTASSPTEGLQLMRDKQFQVVVSDYDMPQMNGINFLREVKMLSPHTIRMMFTATPDITVASEAINTGEVFRFIPKPIDHANFLESLNECLREYEYADRERNLLEHTLNGAVKILMDMLAMVSPLAFSRTNRMQAYVNQMMNLEEIPEKWSFKIGAILSQIGCISVPAQVLQKVIAGVKLTKEEQTTFNQYPEIGARMVAEIPRLEGVAEIVRNHRRKYLEIENLDLDYEIKMATHAVRLLSDFDIALESERHFKTAKDKLRNLASSYHPKIFQHLDLLEPHQLNMTLTSVDAFNLAPGMIFAEDVKDDFGLLLIPKGLEVVWPGIAMLLNHVEIESVSRDRSFQVYENVR